MARDGAAGESSKPRGWASINPEQQDHGVSTNWGAPRTSRQHAALTEPSRAAHATHESAPCADGMHGSALVTPLSQQHTEDCSRPTTRPHGQCGCPQHPLFPQVATTACGTPAAASQAHMMWYQSRGPGHITSLPVQHVLPPPPAAYRKEPELSKRVASLQVGALRRNAHDAMHPAAA